MAIEHLIRDSDNKIRLQLTEDGSAISGAWTALDIYFGGVHLTRAADGDGVSLSTSTGILEISPGDLTTGEKADVAELRAGRSYKVKIVVTSSLNDDGAVFGEDGTGIYFKIADKPA